MWRRKQQRWHWVAGQIIIVSRYWVLVCAMNCDKHLTYTVGTINSPILHMRVGTERLSDSLEATQLIHG